jgi:hypothetical protein
MNKLRIFISKQGLLLKCPACHNADTLHKSKSRTFKENILKNLFFWGYYRCWECNWRGLISNKALAKQSFKILLLYVILAIVSSLVILVILNNVIG